MAEENGQADSIKLPSELVQAAGVAGIAALRDPTPENEAAFEAIVQQTLAAERVAELLGLKEITLEAIALATTGIVGIDESGEPVIDESKVSSDVQTQLYSDRALQSVVNSYLEATFNRTLDFDSPEQSKGDRSR
ncbi:MAG: hypothetical protein K8L99_29435 [Anaerolineae bacterium]|nr:hypothetical protein [Anaerolineae bacterium]